MDNNLVALLAYITFAGLIILIVDLARWAMKQVDAYYGRSTESQE